MDFAVTPSPLWWTVTHLCSRAQCLSRSHWRCNGESWVLRSCSPPSTRRWQSWRRGRRHCWGSCHWWVCQGSHRTQLSGKQHTGKTNDYSDNYKRPRWRGWQSAHPLNFYGRPLYAFYHRSLKNFFYSLITNVKIAFLHHAFWIVWVPQNMS
jgi:hypothetical protein